MTAVNVILSIIKRFWKEILIALLLVVLSFSVSTCKKNMEQKIIARENTEQALRKADENTKLLNMTDDELERTLESNLELKWVLDSLKKNPKVITEIQYIKTTRTVRDTVKIVRTVNLTDTTITSTYEDCGVTAKFSWPLGADYGEWEIEDKNELAIVGIKERKKLFGFLPRMWPAKFERKLILKTHCGDSIINNFKYQRQND